jgi:glycosyltransferase involved in cell wall biosynthesis
MNEQERIGATLEDYATTFPHAEIVVVINGTTDKTEDVVAATERKHRNVRHVVFPDRIGKGGAVIEGFKIASGDLIGFTDADSSTSSTEFKKLVDRMQANDVAGCIASRRIKGAVVATLQPPLRLLAGYVFNAIVRILFLMPYSDTQCGAKLFTAGALKPVLPRLLVKDWAFDVGLLYEIRKAGGKIAEVPVTWRDAKGSKVRLVRTVWQMLRSVTRLRLLHSPLRKLVGG